MIEYDSARKAGMIERAEAGMLNRLAVKEQAFGVLPVDQLTTPGARALQYSRLEQMVGNTPLDSIALPHGTTIWVKRESENPAESHYDRVLVSVLKRLELDGFVKPGDRILEGTSGSAGRSFAWACSRLGYKLDIIVPTPEEIPAERLKDMQALGANVIHADEKGGILKVRRKFRRMLVEIKRAGYERDDYELEGKPIIVFRKGEETIVAPDHSETIITPNAFGTIGDEVVAQLPQGARIDIFISTLGNGATLKGISERLRAAYGSVQVLGVEHRNSPTNAIRKLRQEVGEARMAEEFERIYGFRMPTREEMIYHDSFGASTPGMEPPFVEVDKLDGIILVDNEWREFKRRVNTYAWLLGNTKNLIGNTTAENLHIAYKLAELPGWAGKNILVINYDKADQYPDWPPRLRTYKYPITEPQPEDEVPYSLTSLKAA